MAPSEKKAQSVSKNSDDPGSLSLAERKTKERKEREAKEASVKAMGAFKTMVEDWMINTTDFNI